MGLNAYLALVGNSAMPGKSLSAGHKKARTQRCAPIKSATAVTYALACF